MRCSHNQTPRAAVVPGARLQRSRASSRFAAALFFSAIITRVAGAASARETGSDNGRCHAAFVLPVLAAFSLAPHRLHRTVARRGKGGAGAPAHCGLSPRHAPEPCETVRRRYYRWIEMGVLDAILAALAREADLEWLMIDSTIVRAHQQAAGARRQKGGRMPRALVARAAA
jgi:hypothetical protein